MRIRKLYEAWRKTRDGQIAAAVLEQLELRVRNGGPETMCLALFPLNTGGIVRCGRYRDHAGAHEFRWEAP